MLIHGMAVRFSEKTFHRVLISLLFIALNQLAQNLFPSPPLWCRASIVVSLGADGGGEEKLSSPFSWVSHIVPRVLSSLKGSIPVSLMGGKLSIWFSEIDRIKRIYSY